MEQAASGASVGIIGLGYVGLPLAVEFAEAGHQVVALDADASKVAAIEAGRSYIEDIPSERLAAVRERLHPTTRYAALAQVDAIVIAVPTPLNENREPDLRRSSRPARRSRACCRKASSSCSSRPRTRAPRASGSRRCSRSPAWSRAARSTSPSRPSASTRAAPTSRSGRRRRSSAA